MVFHSRDKFYRNPTGAIMEKTPVHFKIVLPREAGCSNALLIVQADSGEMHRFDMFWCGMRGESEECWECDYIPDSSGLFFYHFEIRTKFGFRSIYRGSDSQAAITGNNLWQLTVYSKDLKTPDWLAGGIIYQIFPDRFRRSSKEKMGVPADRIMHKTWEEQPQWRPDKNGEITNNDYFGGDLEGIREKLPYLKSLGVTCIYLNPIFESHSNHRYDTADYSRVDPLLGDNDDFERLCSDAKDIGISVILDGVFNHAGSDSIYFNRKGRYDNLGAYQSEQSPYFSWFSFRKWPDEYDCWWNFNTLPDIRESDPSFCDYMLSENGIIRRWIRAGARGWRLDVADELPDEFLDKLHACAREENPEALIMGEVWEDATNKMAYGFRRRYLLGGQLDSVMNYPFHEAIINFLTGGDISIFTEIVGNVLENYPKQCLDLLMNHIGTHDIPRILTTLIPRHDANDSRQWQSEQCLTESELNLAVKKLKIASVIQFTLPGVPSIYYGDEAGMQGWRDPFNRGTYPWGHENKELLSHYRALGALRNENDVFKLGEFKMLFAQGDVLAYMRHCSNSGIIVCVNRSEHSAEIPEVIGILGSRVVLGQNPENSVLPPYGFCVLKMNS